jgi:hypothetical protein
MVAPDRVEVPRRIAASAHTIFLVGDPSRHVDLDGSGMLLGGSRRQADHRGWPAIDMDMDRRPWGTSPTWRSTGCTVTRLFPDRLIEWTVQATGKPPAGHGWGWQIQSLTDGDGQVTKYRDWSGMSDELRERFASPVVPVDRLEHSLDNLTQLAAEHRPRRGAVTS